MEITATELVKDRVPRDALYRSLLHSSVHFCEYTDDTMGALVEAFLERFGCQWNLIVRQYADQSYNGTSSIWYVASISDAFKDYAPMDATYLHQLDLFVLGFLKARSKKGKFNG